MKAKISNIISLICLFLAWGTIGAMDNGAPLSTFWWTIAFIAAAIVSCIVGHIQIVDDDEDYYD